MPISSKVKDSIERSSWIRKMFEEGARLKNEYGEENVFDFSLGNPDLDPPVEFFDIMKELISEKKRGAHGYMPNAGFPDVRENIAKMVSDVQGIDIEGNNIVMTCGAAGGLNVVFKTILDPGEEVIVPKPYFAEYGFYIDNQGGELVLAGTNDDFSLNINNIKKAINEKTRAVLINSPNNPTGRVYTDDEIKSLSGLLESYTDKGQTIFLISDEPYREMVYENRRVPSILKYYKQSIVVTSYSKSLSIPGERIGYIAVNPECLDLNEIMPGLILCNRILGFVNAPAIMQRLVARLDGVSVDVSTYRRRRDLLIEGLKSAGYKYADPQGAFYIFCRSPIEDDIEFVRHLQKYNILVVPGKGFGGPGYFRIAYCVSESVIDKAIPRFKDALDSLKKE